MAADFKFLMEFGVESKEVDSVLSSIRGIKATLTEIKSAGTLGDVMGTEDIEEAKIALDKMISSLERMKQEGQDLINADEMARECQRLTAELNRVDSSMEEVERTSDDVEDNLRDATRETRSFRAALNEVAGTMTTVHKASDNINRAFTKLGDTIKWKVIDTAVNSIQGGLQSSYYFAKDLDRVMTEIRIVTGDTALEVENFVNQTGGLADELGSTMLKFSEASVLFLQQGKTREDAIELAKQTVIAANITGVSSRQAAELMTAAQEGFRRSAEEASNTLDVFARLGAETGSNFEEIATALSKSASSFSAAGFDIERASAALATVSSVTRQSAEQVGTGFKTIIARLTSVKAGGEEGAEAVSKIETALRGVNREMGLAEEDVITIFGKDGDMKDGQAILETIGDNWERIKDSTSQVTQNILLEAVAGKEQANRMLALYENWDMYQDAVQKAIDSEGYAYQQQLIYQDSLKAKLSELSNEFQRLFTSGVGVDPFKDLIGSATDLIGKFNELAERGVLFQKIITPISSVIGIKMLQNVNAVSTSFGNWVNNINPSHIAIEKMQIGMQKMLGIDTQRDIQLQKQLADYQRKLVINEQLLQQDMLTLEVGKRRNLLTEQEIIELEKKIVKQQEYVALVQKGITIKQSELNSGGKLASVIKDTSTLLTFGLQLGTAVKTITSETATMNDKWDSFIKTAATGLGGLVGGPIGALVGSLVGDVLGAFINIESQAEKTAKKMKEFAEASKEANKAFAESMSEYNDMQNKLYEIRTEMDIVEDSTMSYADALKILSDDSGKYSEEQVKVAEAVETVKLQQGAILEQLDPAMIYYDKMGRAIAIQTQNYNDLADAILRMKAAEADAYLGETSNIISISARAQDVNERLAEAVKKVEEANEKQYTSEKAKKEAVLAASQELEKIRGEYSALETEIKNFTSIMTTADATLQSMNPEYREAVSNLYNYKDILKIVTGEVDYSVDAYQKAAQGVSEYVNSLEGDKLEKFSNLAIEQKNFLLEAFAEMGYGVDEIKNVLGTVEDYENFFANLNTNLSGYTTARREEILKLQEDQERYGELRQRMFDLNDEIIKANMMATDEEGQKKVNDLLQEEVRVRRELTDTMDRLVDAELARKEYAAGGEDYLQFDYDRVGLLEQELALEEDRLDLQERYNAMLGDMVPVQEEVNEALDEGNENAYNFIDSLERIAEDGIEAFEKLGVAARKDLINALKDFQDEVPGITDLIVDMTDGSIDNIELLEKTWNNLVDALEGSDPAIIEEFALASEDYFERWKLANSELYLSILEDYGLEAEEFQTLQEFKLGLLQAFLVEQGVNEDTRLAIIQAGSLEEYKIRVQAALEAAIIEEEKQAQVLQDTLNNVEYMKHASISAIMAIEQTANAAAENVRKLRQELENVDSLISTRDTLFDPSMFNKPSTILNKDVYKPKEKKEKKAKEKKEKDVADIIYDEDILHKYEKQLTVIEDKLAKLGRAYDHAFGYDKIKNLQEQNKLLEERADILRVELKLIEKQTEGYAELLQKEGFAMNDVGTIINKDDVFKRLYDEANAKEGEKARTQAQEKVKAIEEAFSKYEANVKLKIDTTKALNEAFHEIQDNYREGFEIDLNLVLDVNKLLREVKEVQDSMVNGFGSAAKQMDNLASSWQAGAQDLDRIAFNMERIVTDPKLDAVAKYDLMQDNMSQFISEFEKLQDTFEEILELQKEVVTESAELVQTQLEGYEKLIGYASELASLYSSFYGDDGYKKASDFYAIQIKGIKEQEKGTQGLIDSLDIYLKKLESAGQKGSEAWKETKKQIADLQDQMVQLAAETVSVLQQQYDQFIDVAINKLQQSLFGMSFDELSNKMNKLEKSQAKYLDTTEKVVKVSDLHAKIQNQINKLNDPARQAELTEQLQKQMEMLREKDGLTERDLKRAELQYQLLLKQQAAEAQAQTGKMVGRLTRDESGNWAMEYVADLEEVEKAQEELSETLNSLVAFDRESLEQNQGEIMDLLGDFNKRSQDIIKEYKNNPAEMARQLEKLEKEFGKELDVLRKEREELMKNYMESSINSIFEVAKTDEKALDVFGKANAETLKKITKALASGDLNTEDVLSKNTGKIAGALGLDVKDVEKALDSMFKQINSDFKDFNNILGDIDVSDIGSAFDQIVGQSQSMINEITSAMKDYENAIGDLNKKLEEQRKATEEANKESASQLEEVGKLVESFGSEGGLNDQFKAANEFATIYFDTLKNRLTEVKNHIEQTDIYTQSQLNSEKQLDKTTKATDINTKSSEVLQKQTEKTDKATVNATGKMVAFEGQLYDTNSAARAATNGVNSLHDSIDELHDKTITITTVYQSVGGGSYDIGGYTGDKPYAGGIDGKGGFPATLHPQELILDKYDTKNMLKAIEAVRDVAKTGMLKNINSVSSSLTNKVQSSISNVSEQNSQTTDQTYIVENINLPNVDNAQEFAQELKSIFSNMSNGASQYSLRRKAY